MVSRRFCPLVCSVLVVAALSGCRSVVDYSQLEASETVRLPAFYADHMVFQRGEPIVVRGTATAGRKVSVSLNGQVRRAVVSADGSWRVELPAMKAGGPYQLAVSGKETIMFTDILVGDVWICSGQSNMQWSVKRSDRAEQEIAAADHPTIRLFTVKLDRSPFEPKDDVSGQWHVCSPQSVPEFSGVGYFFGRELNRELNVPIGLVNSSWGGTMIEPWISRAGFQSSPDFQDIVAMQEQARKGQKQMDAKSAFLDWVEQVETFYQKQGQAALGWGAPDLKDKAGWKTMALPGAWEQSGLAIDGAVWFRKTVTLPEACAGRDLTLSLGRIDDCDTTYFNGVKVGQTGPEVEAHWASKRAYTVPGSLVKTGENVIAVRVFDHFSSGGIFGPAQLMSVACGGSKQFLAGEWQYKVEYAMDYAKVPMRPRVPEDSKSQQFPSTLYNAMIHPLVDFPVKGAIWYQGESNAGNPDAYRKLFPLLLQDWRRAWKNPDLVFLWAQLSAFYRHTPREPLPEDFFKTMKPEDPSWARLREAQLQTLAVPRTGMAVTIDVGNPIDIHPTNKQDVGKRLALAARKVAYNQDICFSGPVYEAMAIQGDSIRLSFKHVCKGLVAKEGALKQFAIAGPDKEFHWAEARIEGRSVVVRSDRVPQPVAVRYAWGKYPEGCNLFNSAGLPATPFRTDDW